MQVRPGARSCSHVTSIQWSRDASLKRNVNFPPGSTTGCRAASPRSPLAEYLWTTTLRASEAPRLVSAIRGTDKLFASGSAHQAGCRLISRLWFRHCMTRLHVVMASVAAAIPMVI